MKKKLPSKLQQELAAEMKKVTSGRLHVSKEPKIELTLEMLHKRQQALNNVLVLQGCQIEKLEREKGWAKTSEELDRKISHRCGTLEGWIADLKEHVKSIGLAVNKLECSTKTPPNFKPVAVPCCATCVSGWSDPETYICAMYNNKHVPGHFVCDSWRARK